MTRSFDSDGGMQGRNGVASSCKVQLLVLCLLVLAGWPRVAGTVRPLFQPRRFCAAL
jgi:hypothetical protein